jgi:hypothetical protein
VLFKSEVRCLFSTGAPALRSLQDIWLIPVAFLILIFLPSFVLVSVFVGLFGAFFMTSHLTFK